MFPLGFYAYLHLYLQRLWEALASLPSVFPDHRTLDQAAYPWLLNGMICALRPRARRFTSAPLLLHKNVGAGCGGYQCRNSSQRFGFS